MLFKDNMTKTTKSLITIPENLNRRIDIYQAKKQISLKNKAIIQMLEDYCNTKDGKELTY